MSFKAFEHFRDSRTIYGFTDFLGEDSTLKILGSNTSLGPIWSDLEAQLDSHHHNSIAERAFGALPRCEMWFRHSNKTKLLFL